MAALYWLKTPSPPLKLSNPIVVYDGLHSIPVKHHELESDEHKEHHDVDVKVKVT